MLNARQNMPRHRANKIKTHQNFPGERCHPTTTQSLTEVTRPAGLSVCLFPNFCFVLFLYIQIQFWRQLSASARGCMTHTLQCKTASWESPRLFMLMSLRAEAHKAWEKKRQPLFDFKKADISNNNKMTRHEQTTTLKAIGKASDTV